MPAKKKSGGKSSGSKAEGRTLRNVVTSAAATETLLDLVDRFGLVDVVVGRVKAKIEETDVDELFDEIAVYLRRNPEVLVVSLGAVTVATGLLVWLNSRREWDGSERRRTWDDDDETTQTRSSSGRTRKAS